MSIELSRPELRALVSRLAQNYNQNLRVGNSSVFPTLEELMDLRNPMNCSLKFSKIYQLDKVVAQGGASGATIIALKSLGEKKRLQRLDQIVDKLPLVVKKVNLEDDIEDEENFMDIVIGSRLNILIAAGIAPNFMRTVDWFICHDIQTNDYDASVLYTILERQEGELVKHLLAVRPDIERLKSFLTQILFTLEAAQATMEYVHYDLHAGNVLVRVARSDDMRTADFWQYIRPNGASLWISADDANHHEAIIIDFGRNRMLSPKFTENGLTQKGSQILYLTDMESVGISEDFNKQWDMRRFALHFVEAIFENSEKPEPTAPVRRTRGRKSQPKKMVDYFEKLRRAYPRIYGDLIDVLNIMSGHQHVVTREYINTLRLRGKARKTKSPEQIRALELYNKYFDVLITETDSADEVKYPDLTMDELDRVLEKFREGGIEWLIKIGRKEKNHYFEYLAFMWGWTEFTFVETVTDVLELPFFDNLKQEPTVANNVVIVADAENRFLSPNVASSIECEAPGCSEVATKACQCGEIFYCSTNCFQVHQKVHHLDCPLVRK